MAAPLTVPRPKLETPARKGSSVGWKFPAFLAVLAVAVGVAYFSGALTKEGLKETWKHYTVTEVAPPDPVPDKHATNVPWDGLVAVKAEDEAAIGFNFARVKAQTAPILLELNGRTAYDTTTITKVRPRFDTIVTNVYAEVGQTVKKGEPLVELFSTDLAAAKSDLQSKYVQWQHDLNLYNLRQKLVESGAISQQLWVDTKNDEQKSRLEYNLAVDKLKVTYEVPIGELDPLLENLGDKVDGPRQFGSATDKAKLTMRSQADGIVIKRDVGKGNYYETNSEFMQIAPLDHLWVMVNVYEIDQDKVEKGQKMMIQFLSHEQQIEGKVDFVASEVSQDTRAVKVRASIPNPEGRLKAEMLVKAMLEIPPTKGQTVVPRLAVVSVSGVEYVFVRKAANVQAGGDPTQSFDKFERRKVYIAQENSDNAIIASGLEPGMVVATNGSIILAQLYEDQRASTTGLPAE